MAIQDTHWSESEQEKKEVRRRFGVTFGPESSVGLYVLAWLGSSMARKVMVFSMKGVQAMKLYTMVMTGLVLVGAASLASANPSMLPKHPGYPSGGEMVNHSGSKTGRPRSIPQGSCGVEDAHTGQTLVDPNNARLVKPQGAGQLPMVEGPTLRLSRRSLRRLACPSRSALLTREGRASQMSAPYVLPLLSGGRR